MMTHRIFAVALAVATLPLAAGARTLSPDEAWARATRQAAVSQPSAAALSTPSAGMTPALAMTYTKDSEAAVYVFNNPGGRGFSLVAAASAAPRALLGFSENGTFDPAAMPPGLEWLLDTYAGELAAAADDGSAVTDSVDNRADIAPLLTTTWGQLAPFNDLAPQLGESRAPAGCVALSMAQCMKHFNWPAKGSGTVSYEWYYSGNPSRLGCDLDTIPFDWDNMIDNYVDGDSASGTPAQRSAVARLCYALGMSVSMQYEPTGSSSSVSEAAEALVRYFDYAETVCFHQRDYYEFEEWKAMVYDELAASRPVLYQGAGTSGSHAFVCDGYRTGGYFHFNWGWYGSYDGFFLLSALNPAYRAGEYESGYNSHQSAITGLTPAPLSAGQIDDLYLVGDFSTEYTKYRRTSGGTVTFTGESAIYSQSYAPATVTLGVALTAPDGTVTYVEADSTVTFANFRPVVSYSVDMSRFPTSGSYTAEPYFRQADGVWRPIRAKLSNVRSRSLRCTPTTLTFGDSPDEPQLTFTDMHLNSPLFTGCEFSFSTTVANSGGEFYEDIYVVLTDTTGTKIVGRGPVIELDVERDDAVAAEWIGKLTAQGSNKLIPGRYRMGLANVVDYAITLFSPTIEVELRAAPLDTRAYTVGTVLIDGSSTAQTSPAQAGASTRVSFTVNCSQGYFGERVALWVTHPESDMRLLETDSRFVGAEAGTSATVDYEADFSSLDPDVVYCVRPYGVETGLLDAEPAYITLSSTGIAAVTSGGSPAVYPNPATGPVTVVAPADIESVGLWSVTGGAWRPAADIDGCTARLDVGSLPPGIYIVRIDTHAGPLTAKLIRR